jgi:hypothetical protein
MQVPPFYDKRLHARGKSAMNVGIGDANRHLLSSVPGVKVSWLMLAMVHGDDDAEETTNLRHSFRLYLTLSGCSTVVRRLALAMTPIQLNRMLSST